MILAPTDAELSAFAKAASSPGYEFTSFDIRYHNRCIFGHVKWMRGDRTYINDDFGRMMDAAVWATGNTRLIRLIGIERKPNIKAEHLSSDVNKRTDIGMRFSLADAVNAVNRYFDTTIEETAIWPWAARGFPNITRWMAK